MNVPQLDITPDRADVLYREYLAHRHFAKPIDDEIRRTYREIAKGGVVIRALDAIRDAGLGADRLPKLAIIRADAPECYLSTRSDGWVRFSVQAWVRDNHTNRYIDLPEGSFPGIEHRYNHRAIVPLIPLKFRPKIGLEKYHILWEAEWERVVPRDPLLLRRLGAGDLWLVVAAWDLTEVEQAALAARVRG